MIIVSSVILNFLIILAEIEAKTAVLDRLEQEEKTLLDKFKQEEITHEQQTIEFLIKVLGLNKLKASSGTIDVANALKVFLSVTSSSEDDVRAIISTHVPAAASTSTDTDNHDTEHHDNGEEEVQQNNEHDEHTHHEHDASADTNTNTNPIPSCSLATVDEQSANHVLQYICQYLPTTDTSPAPTAEDIHRALYDMAEMIILNLIQDKKYYNEAQLVFGKSCHY